MKIIIIAFSLLTLIACAAETENQENSSDPIIAEMDDTLAIIEEIIDTVIVEQELPEGQMNEEDFLALFKYDFEHIYDFGWRFIESNYDDQEPESDIEKTPYDEEHDLSPVTSLKIITDDDETISPIGFEGYAHSQKWINGNRLLVTYMQYEISEEFYYYFVDSDYTILKEGYLATNGGDEGTWYYTFGEFSKDYSVYQMTEVNGEALDTFEIVTDVIYF